MDIPNFDVLSPMVILKRRSSSGDIGEVATMNARPSMNETILRSWLHRMDARLQVHEADMVEIRKVALHLRRRLSIDHVKMQDILRTTPAGADPTFGDPTAALRAYEPSWEVFTVEVDFPKDIHDKVISSTTSGS
jgi:hypothetical protein